MSAVNQKEYLKKYLSIGSEPGKKKKRKKAHKAISNRVKIIDDDVDIAATFNAAVEEDLYGTAEDAPQIVGITDDRPLELRANDYKISEMWKPLGRDKSPIPEPDIKLEPNSDNDSQDDGRRTNKKKERNLISPSRIKREDESPPRRARKNSEDASPPRNRKQGNSSPPRRRSSVDSSPHRVKRENSSPPRRRNSADASPPRRRKNDDSSPPRKRREENLSPSRKKREEDSSPPRRRNDLNSSPSRKRRNEDSSPPRRQKDNDSSPPRKRRDEDSSPPRRRKGNDSSPPRKRKDEDSSPPRRRKNDDSSPPRKRKNQDSSPPRRRKDNDSSPPRKSKHNENEPRKKSRWNNSPDRSDNQREPSVSINISEITKKLKKTLDGKAAGLQNAKELAKETAAFKKREDEIFKKMSEEVSGVNAETIVRDKKTGKLRNTAEEAEIARQKEEEENKRKEKYNVWGKGVKQVDDHNEKIKQDLYEMSKPLARYADDEDLEQYLKEQEREGDPMLAYIRKKKRKKAVVEGKQVKPEYMGEFMPNRYGIRPGHRWDGVDRSNGYERKWFENINKRKALQEESYRWNSEDM